MPTTYPLYKRLDWVNTTFLIVTPLVAATWTPVHLYFYGLEWKVLTFFFIYSVITSLSITGGYHRLIAHRAYQVRGWVKVLYLLFGAAAFQGSALKWCSAHRDHHRFVDTDGDPYSIKKGFLYAHIGWVFFRDDPNNPLEFAPDLKSDPWIKWQHDYYFFISFFMGFGIPTLVGWMMGSPLGGLLWAGFLRAVFTMHCTFLINSACHFIGTQPYSHKNSARDNFFMAFFTYGEGYHNYHHKFQADYRNGIRWYHWDPTKWLIKGMEKLRFASNLKKVSPDEILKARLSIEEEMLLRRGVPAETLSNFRLRLEEAQKRLTRLKSDYAAFKADKRNQFDRYFEEKRRQYETLRDEATLTYDRMAESWDMQKQALRTQVREAKTQFRIARQQWNELRSASVT